MHYALRSSTSSLFALLRCSAVHCASFISVGICIFRGGWSVHANIGSTITNILIINIIIQIPEGALLTCMPPTLLCPPPNPPISAGTGGKTV